MQSRIEEFVLNRQSKGDGINTGGAVVVVVLVVVVSHVLSEHGGNVVVVEVCENVEEVDIMAMSAQFLYCS